MDELQNRAAPRREIRELSDQLISQIAAGEVIERPASVVKELVENSIDAGSTQIEVRLEGGGVKRILIADNGCGIAKDDLPLALKRHATSKVRNLDELESVASLGFRGEALASVASVSDLKLVSREEGQNAYMIFEGEISQASATKGTRIEVSDLFYKTPARRKFLKSDATEAAHCLTCVQRISLVNPQIDFSVFVNGKSVLSLPASTLEARLERLMPKDFLSAHRTIQLSTPGVSLRGWVSLPTASRSKTDCQYFYVNGRFVRDKVLTHAVRQAYADVLHGSSQPMYCLFLDMDPRRVDVNVHPTKSEVRFRDSQAIHQFVFHAVEQAISETVIVNPDTGEVVATSQNPTIAPLPTEDDPRQQARVAQTVDSVSSQYTKPAEATRPQSVQSFLDFSTTQSVSSFRPNPFPTTVASMVVPESTASSFTTAQTAPIPQEPTPSFGQNPVEVHQPLGRAVGQLAGTFIVAENEKGMVLVDMHAAHERIVYEKLKKRFDENDPSIEQFLIPYVFTVTPEQMAVFEENRDNLLRLGLEVSAAGANQLSLRGAPFILDNKIGRDGADMVRDVLEDFRKYGSSSVMKEKRNEVLATMACHSAVRLHRALTLPEMDAILRQMEVTDRADECNHGRPTWVQLTHKELDGFFMRGK